MQLATTLRSTITIPEIEPSVRERSAIRATAARWWKRLRWSGLILALTLAIPIFQGYHPLAEDGGLYVAGVELTLDRTLFPDFTDFVSEHLHYSVFAPVVAGITRLTHLPLLWVLLLTEVLSIVLMLTAARALLRRVTGDQRAQFAGVATLAALWTVPIAGTSLLLMDPYVTARSLSTPLSLWSVAFALDDWKTKPGSFAGCVLTTALAASFHPLMAGYALGLVIVLQALRSRHGTRLLIALATLTLAVAAFLQGRAPADSPAVVLAAKSRYYWFLSQWHWYELFGLIAPLLVLFALTRINRSGLSARGVRLPTAGILYGCFATAVTLLFAHEGYRSHIVARLQPLRAFLILYAVMLLLLGASVQQMLNRFSSRAPSELSSFRRVARYALAPVLLVGALAMFFAQRQQFPASAHIELPWHLRQNPNPWVRAFLWCRDNTPQSALFAIDAHYITTPGEDAQTFRSIALRSVLPDFSKDGGEAAITPRLANEWATGFTAQLKLDDKTAPELRAHLAPYGVGWVILRTSSTAALDCPYNNGLLKVCRLTLRLPRSSDVAEQTLARAAPQ